MIDPYHQLLEDPAKFADMRFDDGFHLSTQQLYDIHLAGVQRRFAQMRDRVATLGRLADEQGITRIDTLDDVAPLLFPHTMYKSYPLAYLERSQFDRLTKWLNALTMVDLSQVDATGIETIDDWIALLERTTPLRVNHTFGTTGKLSFIPRTQANWETAAKLTARLFRDWNGPDTGPDLLQTPMPMIVPGHRLGAAAANRHMRELAERYSGGEALFLYPDTYFSADVASIAGRLRAAEARGEQGQLEMSPALLARREEFARTERERPQALERFFEEARQRFSGRDVYVASAKPLVFEWAQTGLDRGLKGVFGPNGWVVTGGGNKGRELPDDWKETVTEFMGFSNHCEIFGMSEVLVNAPRCSEGNFHLSPVVVSFVLDPASGLPLPRTGRQTGRLAQFDLLADTYWGGFITGDEVTMAGWDSPCACGRRGLYLEGGIRRYSEAEGGTDKINCAGAPEAHEHAIDYILAQS